MKKSCLRINIDQGGAGGHAWVFDGSMIIMETTSTTIANITIKTPI